MDGRQNNAGRLEILRLGKFHWEWGTLCSVDFNETDAGVVCQQLGLGSKGSLVPQQDLVPANDSVPIFGGKVACNGTERRLQVSA